MAIKTYAADSLAVRMVNLDNQVGNSYVHCLVDKPFHRAVGHTDLGLENQQIGMQSVGVKAELHSVGSLDLGLDENHPVVHQRLAALVVVLGERALRRPFERSPPPSFGLSIPCESL